jgi:hypothetical protein
MEPRVHELLLLNRARCSKLQGAIGDICGFSAATAVERRS